MNNKTVIKIDASFLSNSGCSLREFYILIEQLQEPMVSIDVQYGSAFHHFAAEVRKTNGNIALAMKGAREILARPCIIKEKKEWMTDHKHFLYICSEFYEWIQKDNLELFRLDDGELFIEKNFSIVIYEDDFLIIMLCGTIDFFGKVKNGFPAICDFKTTSLKDEKVFFYPFQLSVQLRTYLFAIKWHIAQYPDSPFWQSVAKDPIGCFIYGIFLEPPSASKPSRFIRSDVISLSDYDMDEYDKLLQRKTHHLVQLFRDYKIFNQIPIREGIMTGACDKKFTLCQYAPLCMTNNETFRGHLKNNKFVVKPYDPMLFSK